MSATRAQRTRLAMAPARAASRSGSGSTAGALALAMLLGTSVAQSAVLFDFNGVSLSGNHSNGLGATGGNAAIGTYMSNTLHSQGFAGSNVSVSGGLATATYNGEGHVPGITLGTSDGGVAHAGHDTFIINDNFNVYGQGAASQFTFTFTNFSITSLSFDWEIFPDATCPKGSYCASHPGDANYPDIELLVDGTNVWQMLATTSPGLDPQAIGTFAMSFLTGVHTLTIRDWPAEVGIDNLRIGGCAPTITYQGPRNAADVVDQTCTPLQVPEPSSLPLAALALGAAALGIGRGRVARRVKN